jgi:hypothetical protein
MRREKLPAELVDRARELLQQGQSSRVIAARVGISVSSVLRIRRRLRATPAPTALKCKTCRASVTAVDDRGDCLACKVIREPRASCNHHADTEDTEQAGAAAQSAIRNPKSEIASNPPPDWTL